MDKRTDSQTQMREEHLQTKQENQESAIESWGWTNNADDASKVSTTENRK
jgi:hypothetical protein